MKKISVIIPCYNVEFYIDKCIESIIVQTIGKENLEIICIDDASTDGTWKHLQMWEERYPENIALFHQEVNRRQGTARNIGLQYASADWIAFVDADDWLEPDYFEQLYTPAVRFDCDVAACRWGTDDSHTLSYFDEVHRQEGEDQYITIDSEEKRAWFFKYKNMGEGPVAKLIRRKFLMDSSILFPDDVAYEDHYWIPLLYIYAQTIYIVGKRLYHYYLSPDSTVRSKNKDYHMDWITVQLMKWTDYEKRGLWQKYPEIFEGDALNDAAGFVKMLMLRYDEPSFSLFMLESELIKKQVPDYTKNSYMADLPELYRTYLEALYTPMDKTIFQQVVYNIKKYYGVI